MFGSHSSPSLRVLRPNLLKYNTLLLNYYYYYCHCTMSAAAARRKISMKCTRFALPRKKHGSRGGRGIRDPRSSDLPRIPPKRVCACALVCGTCTRMRAHEGNEDGARGKTRGGSPLKDREGLPRSRAGPGEPISEFGGLAGGASYVSLKCHVTISDCGAFRWGTAAADS